MRGIATALLCATLALQPVGAAAADAATAANPTTPAKKPPPTSAKPPPAPPPPAEKASRTKELLTDAAIIAALIALSIAAYRAGGPGKCACPDDTDKAGHRCGARSAHSRSNGWVVACSPADITKQMIEAYRSQQQAAK